MTKQDVAELAETAAVSISSCVAREDKLGASVMLHAYFEDLGALGISPLEGWSVLARYQVSLINQLLSIISGEGIDPVKLMSDIALSQQAAHAH